MSKKIKKLIKKTRHQLKWRVEFSSTREPTLLITSDHWKKLHTISIPDKNDIRDIEILHEYGHALLCETANQMLSTHYFAGDPGSEAVKQITPAARATNDWFVDAWLISIAPAEEKSEILEHYGMICQLPDEYLNNPEMLTAGALMVAQAMKFCSKKHHKKMQVPTLLRKPVKIFLSINPANPTIPNVQNLLNQLLSCYCDLQVRAVKGRDVWCWKVIKKGEQSDVQNI